ncbi:hypothetical protein L6452_32763 [Arctium lappa]|uniref:Uncharacterized protein n=1 Tax=Arctium lappa TaxID=4217 RepID=A0ACB8Z5Q9_ARCLA|nr:hypothetical protein L6452_32763 [Arctium lappa]
MLLLDDKKTIFRVIILLVLKVPHKISRQEADKDNIAKKMLRLEEEKQQPKTIARFLYASYPFALSSCPDQLSHEPSPFNNLKCLRQNDCITRMPTQVRNYLHESSPSTTFLMDLPQKRTRQDKGTMAKKLEEEKQPPETIAEEKRSRPEALPSCLDQLLHEPSPFNQLSHESSPFNNGMCLKQKDCSPRMPPQIRNYLLESSLTATFINDLPQVSPKRSKQEVDKGTMAKKLAMLEEEKQQTETMAEEKRMLEEKIQMQDETIEQQKAMMEAMKLQYEKRTLEDKIEMQDKVIAQQKSMLEAMKLQYENGMLEAKIQMQDLTIVKQKSMLELMKLQHEKKMLVAKIKMQDDIIAQKKDMLEAMRLHRY